MEEKRMETGENPEIIVEAHERLSIRGWDQNVIRAVGPDDALTLEEADGAYRLVCTAGLDLRVPVGAAVRASAFGAISVRDVRGPLHIEQAGDSLQLRGVGETRVGTVANDLTVRSVEGALEVGQVGRFANVREVNGDFKAGAVGAHVNIKDIRGDISVQADGNANLYLELQGKAEAVLGAAGSLTCRTAPGLDARVTIESFDRITVRTADVQENLPEGRFERVFGAGTASVRLSAEGPVSLLEHRRHPEGEYRFEFRLEDDFLEGIGDVEAGVGAQVSEQLSMIEEELQARLGGVSEMVSSLGLSEETSEEIRRRTQEKIDRVQEKIRRAQERAARRISEAQRRAEAKARRAERAEARASRRSPAVDFGDLRRRVRAKSEPVSEEERLMILNMVAENKITLEEAEALLSALDEG